MKTRGWIITIALSLLHCVPAMAQTPINAPGAMQPSTGTGVIHIMPMYRNTGSDPTSGVQSADEYINLTQVAYGLRRDFSLQFDVPLVYRDLELPAGSEAEDDDFGLADMTLLFKYRVFQEDHGPTETTRVSLIAGLQIPGDGAVELEMDSSNGAWDPIVGAVFSTVRGRHGFNIDTLYEFYTGDDDDSVDNQSDSLRYDASYLFRVSPESYTAESTDAIYAVCELNGFYGVNGDHEIFVSPGLMYEARTFTIDATVMLPVHQEVEFRAETDILIGLGIRLSF